jgi:DNA-binding NarL/FixJ family response regulator
MSTEIRLVIADDHPLLRNGLRQVIESDSRLKVLAEAGDGEAALERIEALRPDVAVLDIEMPRLTGFDLLRAIREKKIVVEVVFLTMYKDEEMFNEALDLGAKGYVLKDSAITDITGCIHAVAAGRHYISPAISSYLINRNARSSELIKRKPSLNDLTATERRILKLIAENKTSKQIAAELFISHRTVENHRANICQKLDLKGSHSLIKFAFDHKSQLS